MKTAFITPPSLHEHISPFTDGDYHLVLGQFLDKDWYAPYARRLKGHIIVDNGAAEGQMVDDFDRLCMLAASFGASEVVLPDVLGDTEATARAIKKVLPVIKHWSKQGMGFMGVVQGQSLRDAISMMSFYEVADYVSASGIPRRWLVQNGRVVSAWRNSFMSVYKPTKPVHYLGIGEDMTEVQTTPKWVRGIDTSAPVSLGLDEIDMKETPTYHGRSEQFWGENFTAEQVDMAIHNVRTFKQWTDAIH